MGSVVSGSRVGRYVVLEELGGGGMGVVYRARDEEAERDVALKVLRQSSPDAVRRMRREARATEGLDRTRIAQVYEVGETPEGDLYLAMEYVHGRTLREIMRRGAVERKEALRIIGEVATALGEAHRAGVVHRDVKPENVMVRDDGRVVLLDFGIAKQLEASDDAAQATTQLTSEGTMIGTPAYLAPEQALGREIGPAVDQFALAVTAFELLTGKLPWTATEVTRILAQLLAETPPAASTLNRAVPRPFDAVLWRALQKVPGERFPSVEQFAEALEAAERGEFMPSPASQTVEAPIPQEPSGANRGRTQEPPPARSRMRPALAALAVVALVGAGVTVRARMGAPREASRAEQAAPALTVSSGSPLACPIFEVSGLPEFATWIGAAASTLACARAKWYLGGRDDGVLPPAALLDAPVQPTATLPGFYDDPGQREHTLDVARKRGLASLDGRVVRDRDSWRVDIFLRAPDGREIARAEGSEGDLLVHAVREGVSRLWQQPGLKPTTINADVARWTALPDVEAGLVATDFEQSVDTKEACVAVERRGTALGRALYPLHDDCDGPLPDAGAPAVDESSPAALVTSLNAVRYAGAPLPQEEERRLAQKLDALRAAEPTRLGRAYLAQTAGAAWDDIDEHDRARTSFLAAVEEDPLLGLAWSSLAMATSTTGSSAAARSLASVWLPYGTAFLNFADSFLSDDLDARLHDARLAYLLRPTVRRIIYLGSALAEAGREDDVRALTAVRPIDRSSPDPHEAAMLLAFIDLHDAKLSRALDRIEEAPEWGLPLVPGLARILGREGPVSAKWAKELLGETERDAKANVIGDASWIALCMSAGAGTSTGCLARIEKLAGASNGWGANGDAFLRGAKRYAVGELRGAVDAWRPVVGGANDRLIRFLPTEAFERMGEDRLAARIDARKLKYRLFAGVSDATPREARRAFKQGDVARARELAQKVVDAWEVADAVIPAVGEMRALLGEIGRR